MATLMHGTSTLAVAGATVSGPAGADSGSTSDTPSVNGSATAGAMSDPARRRSATQGPNAGWRLNVLGPVELCYNGEPVRVSGLTRTLLALLARAPGEEVSTSVLVAGLWGSAAPEDAEKEVASHVSRLRKALTEVAPDVNPTRVVVTLPAGYILDIEPSNADVLAFERLTAEGRRALSVGQPELALARLESALALWRGPAYEDFGDHAFARAEAARLSELRLTAIEARIEARLAIAAPKTPPGLEAELTDLVAEHWHRERLWALLMVTLFRQGRRGDALAACRRAQELLARELGAAYGPELQDVERAVIAGDPLLLGVPRARTTVPAPLATMVPACVGRDQEVAWLLAALDLAATRRAQARLIVGAPGMGKSRLLAEVAQRAAMRGVEIRYFRGSAAGLESLSVETDRLSLIVLDDLDQAPTDDVALTVEFFQSVRTRPVVLLASCRDAASMGDLQRVPKLVMSGLDDDAVAEIVRIYAPNAATGPAAAAMVNTGGVPARVHRAASEWAFHRAGRRIDRAVADSAQPRRWLSSVEAEVIGGVLDLAYVRDRARALRPAPANGFVCPYVGPARYEAADAPLLHGRERLVAELVAGLVRAPFLAVVGTSGSGKSSLVRAGLLPALARGVLPESGLWRQVVLTPGTLGGRLSEYLDAALAAPPPGADSTAIATPDVAAEPPSINATVAGGLPEADQGESTTGLSATGESAAESFAAAASEPAGTAVAGEAIAEPPVVEPAVAEHSVAQASNAAHAALDPNADPRHSPAPAEAIVVIDEFDDVFSLDPAARDEFLDAVVTAAERSRVVVTLRPETYAKCALHPRLARLLGVNSVMVTPMTAEEIARAVSRPAELAGLDIEPGLVERVVADSERQPGDLASLSTALLRTWQRRSGKTLTLAGYLDGGGIAGAIASHAEEAFAALPAQAQDAARAILLRLCSDTRTGQPRNRSLAEVLTEAGPGGSEALERLVEHRLVRLTEVQVPSGEVLEPSSTTGSDGVELTCEALAHYWPRLRDWLIDVTETERMRRQLASAAADWAARERPPARLYRGARLATALEWAARHAADLSPVEREFLQAAERAAMAVENRRRRRIIRLWRWLVASLVVAIFAVAVATVAVVQQIRAIAAADRAEAARIAALASAEPDRRLALRLAIAAAHLDAATAATVGEVLAGAPDLIAVGGDRVRSIALSPDAQLVAAGTDHGVQVMAAASLAPLYRLELAGHAPVHGVAFVDDGRRLVSWGGGAVRSQNAAAGGANIVVWDLATRQPVGGAFGEPWPGPGGGLAVDGETLIVPQHRPDGTVLPGAWNIAARTPSTAYPLPADEIDSVLLGDGRDVVVLGGPRGAVVRNLATGQSLAVPGARAPLALSADAGTLVSAAGTDVQLWDVNTGRLLGTASGSLGQITAAAFAPGGDLFATAAADGRITLWETRSLRPVRVFDGHHVAAVAVLFDGSARTLFSVAAAGPVLAWDLVGDRGAGVNVPADAGRDELVRIACAVVGDGLSHEEWSRFLPHRPYFDTCPN